MMGRLYLQFFISSCRPISKQMISDSNLVSEEQPLFSRPQIFEQLRDQLLSLVRQDTHNLEELLQEMHDDMATVFDWSDTTTQALPDPIQRLTRCLSEFQEQSRERSNNIATLSHLAVKMIDYIRDEQLRHSQIIEKYEAEADTLRNNIEFLSNKNDGIENDVEIFREQLMAAQEELEGIVGEDGGEEMECMDTGEKDRQIEVLQAELEKIKDQLQFYKFNSRSRKSRLLLNDKPTLTPNHSENMLSLPLHQIQQKQHLELQLNRSIKLIDHLQRQNQILKRDIVILSESKIKEHSRSSWQYREIKEELVEETEREMVRNKTIDELGKREDDRRPFLYKATSFTHLMKVPSTPDIEQVEVQPLKIEMEYEDAEVMSQLHQQPSTPLLQTHKCHPLSSEWSTKSFEMHLNNLVYENLKPAKLIFLNQQQQEMTEKGYKLSAFSHHPVFPIQQTRETENSIKGSDSVANDNLKMKKIKDYCSVGVNTAQPQPVVQSVKAECGVICRWETNLVKSIADSPMVGALCDFIIKRRVKRSSEKTSQIINAIVC